MVTTPTNTSGFTFPDLIKKLAEQNAAQRKQAAAQTKQAAAQTEEQEETNSLLGLIGKDFKSFFKDQRNARLDELEKQREAKRASKFVDERGRILSKEDRQENFGLLDLGKILGLIAATAGSVPGSIAGIFLAYKDFWLGQKTLFDKTIKGAQTQRPGAFAWIRATITSLANTIRSATYARLGLGIDGRILTQFNKETRKFERVDTIGARMKDLLRGISTRVNGFTTRYFSGLEKGFKGLFTTDTAKLTVKNPFVRLISGITTTVNGILNSLGVFGNIVRLVFTGVTQLVRRVLVPFVAIKGLIQGFIETDGNLFQKSVNAIINAVQDLFKFLVSDFVGLILKGIGGIFNFFGLEGVGRFMNRVSDAFTSGFDAIFEGLKSFVENPVETGIKFAKMISDGFFATMSAIGDFFSGIWDYIKSIAKNPKGFIISVLRGTREGAVVGEEGEIARGSFEFDRLDEGQQKFAQRQKAELVKLELARVQGKISDEQLKKLRDGIAAVAEAQGVSMQSVISAPQTMINNSSAIAQGAAPATASKTYE